ncbi:protein yellow-like isoform X1 [Teleopsis dalmanni]|uniref:protein yellow-like isoform X1 n=1 Tax=Teleopsis dalmanni TaxID=139649 RepID=UPI0018CEAF46|nr:protein yellow-like isoform X1 [Teleopsis dalmanni]
MKATNLLYNFILVLLYMNVANCSSGWHEHSFWEDETPRISRKSDAFDLINEWKFLDFEYPTYVERQQAIKNNEFITENNLPLGIDVYKNRLFITTPRWKDGVPASLSYVPYPTNERSPALKPYPKWSAHGNTVNPDCTKLISVYRTSIDICGRLWLIDSGIVNALTTFTQLCPPKIVAFDLNTDELILSYELPPDQVKQDSLHSNILADVREGQCHDAYVYVTDVWRFGLVVYSLAKQKSWRITNFNFLPNPVAADFNIYGLNFQWLDGIFGLSLSAESKNFLNNDRMLYFHPMASFKEFVVSTKLIQNDSDNTQNALNFFPIGDRGSNGQSSTSNVDRNGIMFFTQVHRDEIGCWDTSKPYIRENLKFLANENESNMSRLIQFPNDLKVDQEYEQNIWVMSNRLPIFLYSQLDFNDINFRILRANINKVTTGTICDPSVRASTKLKTATLNEGQCL